MEATYEVHSLGNIITGGTAECVEIRFPNHASITKLIVKQTAGTLVNFTVDVYNSAAVSCDDTLAGATDDLFEVLPRQSGVNGILKLFEPQGYPFFNFDGPGSPNSTKIYVKIAPGGTGAKTFAISVGGRSST